ncbi:phosphoglucosamine mutase [Cuniculiplasma sp. SKW3]|uniref:phosphoglucosamine mutase n=1 Tax=Cuniculiplasma sp. SKW3 TaxID=3400170 RepID=UPI003FD4AA81
MHENEPRLFGTNGIRGIPNEDLTPEFCMKIGKAIGTFFGKTVAIGSDNRLSNSMIMDSVISGILSTGVDVKNISILPTPAVQYYCKKNRIPGVIITASHNPPRFNGIKCIDEDGTELERSKEEKIESIYYKNNFKIASWENIGREIQDNSAAELYISGVLSRIDVDTIKKMKLRVIFDAGNGAAYKTTPELLSRLGVSLVTLNANPDGLFTSRESEPKPSNLRYLIDLAKTGEFALGIAHDGDADRAVFVDEKGNFIDGDTTLSLFVQNYIKMGEKVVTPVSSSDAIDDICKEKGAEVIRTKVGAPVVSRTMIEKKARLGGEENGGIIYGDHQYCRDGAMTVGIILDVMAKKGKKLSEIIKEVPEYHITRKTIPRREDFHVIKTKLLKVFPDWNVDETDGVKLRKEHDWILVRPSGTEPIIRIFAHSKSQEMSKRLCDNAEKIIS